MDPHVEHNPPGHHRVTLVKGDQRWEFRCAHGEESDLLARVSFLAASQGVDLDWTDAALIARKLGRRLTADIKTFVAPTGETRRSRRPS